MALVQKDIDINGEVFSIDKIPDATSALVKQTRDGLLGSVDLKGLVSDLGKLGNFIRLAYNGVAGHTELQIKVQRVGYKITKLADKSAVTVHSFKVTSRDVLQELQGTYEYLLDGLEEMALETLSGLAMLADKMAKASEELHNEFEEATTDVISALEDTQTAKGAEEKTKERLKREQQEFEREKKKAEALQKEAMEAESRAEQYFNEAQKREDKAYEKQFDFMTKLCDTFGKVLDAGVAVASMDHEKIVEKLEKIGDDSVHKDAMNKANEEKMKHLEDMKKQRELRRNANQQCIEFAERIKNCRDDESLAEVAIDALHNSVGALKSLSAIMMNAALFWKQMKSHCEELGGEDVRRQVETAMKLSDEKRLKVWTSTAFKKKAVMFYTKWVALDDVCATYMLQIKETRADLYSYLEQNPTIEQSRRNIKDLAIQFHDDLKKAQGEMDQKDMETSKEMQQLASISGKQ